MKEQLKDVRIKIDGLSQLVKSLKFEDNQTVCDLPCCKDKYLSKETEKAYDSLLFSKAWLGKLLGEIGESTPYANDGNRNTVSDIEPAADQAKNLTVDGGWGEMNHIQRVDWLREEMGKLVDEVKDIPQPPITPEFRPTREFSIARTNACNHLCEARFWLGFELQRIKENYEKGS